MQSRRRMALADASPRERKHAGIKAAGKMESADALPLFGWAPAQAPAQETDAAADE